MKTAPKRQDLIAAIGARIAQFQEASNAVDDAAAQALALNHKELQCMTLLLFAGPMPAGTLAAALHLSASERGRMMEHLQLAGYARSVSGSDAYELTEHARAWITTLWGPLHEESLQVLGALTTPQLQFVRQFMERIEPIQAKHAERIRSLLQVPGATRNQVRRGGLSPASLRRVQLYVEANLDRPLPLKDLAARAGLSPFHFARAFRVSAGATPRTFIETRRVERASALLRETTLPLAEIAAKAGLGTQSRFTTTFRKSRGFTPAQYRREHRPHPPRAE